MKGVRRDPVASSNTFESSALIWILLSKKKRTLTPQILERAQIYHRLKNSDYSDFHASDEMQRPVD